MQLITLEAGQVVRFRTRFQIRLPGLPTFVTIHLPAGSLGQIRFVNGVEGHLFLTIVLDGPEGPVEHSLRVYAPGVRAIPTERSTEVLESVNNGLALEPILLGFDQLAGPPVQPDQIHNPLLSYALAKGLIMKSPDKTVTRGSFQHLMRGRLGVLWERGFKIFQRYGRDRSWAITQIFFRASDRSKQLVKVLEQLEDHWKEHRPDPPARVLPPSEATDVLIERLLPSRN